MDNKIDYKNMIEYTNIAFTNDAYKASHEKHIPDFIQNHDSFNKGYAFGILVANILAAIICYILIYFGLGGYVILCLPMFGIGYLLFALSGW